MYNFPDTLNFDYVDNVHKVLTSVFLQMLTLLTLGKQSAMFP